MDDSILTAWAIFLGLAYVLTLALLPSLFGVIRVANRIARDSARALPGAVGILNNTRPIERLSVTANVGRDILNTGQTLVEGSASIAARLAKLGGPKP